MKINSLLLIALLTLPLAAYDYNMANELTKYSELKNDLYIKKISDKRDLIAEKRDVQESIRDYRALKLYANLRK